MSDLVGVVCDSVWISVNRTIQKPVINSINSAVTTPVKDVVWNFLENSVCASVSGHFGNSIRSTLKTTIQEIINFQFLQN